MSIQHRNRRTRRGELHAVLLPSVRLVHARRRRAQLLPAGLSDDLERHTVYGRGGREGAHGEDAADEA